MLGKVLALSTLCAFVLLSALMQSTTPASIHPIGILFVFILLYVLALGVLTFLIFGAVRMISVLKRSAGHTLSLQRAYLFASVVALAPVMIIGIASIGRLSAYEVLLVVLFEIVACFYISKQR